MPTDAIAEETLTASRDALLHRISTTLEQTGDRFPFVADPDTGEWETTADGNWCGGHWVGLLWLASEWATEAGTDVGEHEDALDPDRFERAARGHTATLREAMPETTMFCGMNFHYAGFLGYDNSGDRDLFGLGLRGADAMVDLFDEAARQIRVGNYRIRGPAAQFDMEREVEGRPTGENVAVCDTVYTSLPVLWRAYRETNDPRFRDVALSHANRHVDWYQQPDGSTVHMASFDPATGEPEAWFDTLAYSEETCWARGQGWHVAGLSIAFRETGATRYLDALERSVEYYVEHTPDDLVPFWDFEDPRIPDVSRDTSSAALTAYGLTQLPREDERTARLCSTGLRVLDSLLDGYLVTDDPDRRGMVLHGCYNYPGDYAVDDELVWTDFYVARTVDRLLGGA